MPQKADAASGFLTWLTEAATWLLGSEGVLLAALGLLIILGFRRDRLIANYKQLVVAEARLAAQHPDGPTRLKENFRIGRIPDEPWGFWRRRLSDRCLVWRVKHYRMVLLIGDDDDGSEVVLIWEAAPTKQDVINTVLESYEYGAMAPQPPVPDDDDHTVVPLNDKTILIVEPAGRLWRWRRWRRSRKRRRTRGSRDESSQSPNPSPKPPTSTTV